jgi:hypothetical protein
LWGTFFGIRGKRSDVGRWLLSSWMLVWMSFQSSQILTWDVLGLNFVGFLSDNFRSQTFAV